MGLELGVGVGIADALGLLLADLLDKEEMF